MASTRDAQTTSEAPWTRPVPARTLGKVSAVCFFA